MKLLFGEIGCVCRDLMSPPYALILTLSMRAVSDLKWLYLLLHHATPISSKILINVVPNSLFRKVLPKQNIELNKNEIKMKFLKTLAFIEKSSDKIYIVHCIYEPRTNSDTGVINYWLVSSMPIKTTKYVWTAWMLIYITTLKNIAVVVDW